MRIQSRRGVNAAPLKQAGSNLITAPVKNGRRTLRVKACEPETIGNHLPASVAIVKNSGPGPICVTTGYDDVHAVLMSGARRAIPVRDYVRFAIIGYTQLATVRVLLLDPE
ncbi:MAG: hypothetical protein WBD95_07625 [Xanthobacteraceae bacterium]